MYGSVLQVWVGSTGVGQFYRWTAISGTGEMNLLLIIDFKNLIIYSFATVIKINK